jgi:hypothetical protein
LPVQRGLRKLPHSVLFALVNMAYCLPVLAAYVFGFAEGGVEATLDIGPSEMVRFAVVYLAAVLSFHGGAWFIWKFPVTYRPDRARTGYARSEGSPWIKRLVVVFCAALVVTKVLLIPEGVYQGYVFDAELAVGSLWTTSMFLSESLVILLLAVLIQERRVTSPWFLIGFACLSLNLLHGTRIFTTAVTLEVVVYFWITRKLTPRLLACGVMGLAAAMLVLFATFSLRTDYQYSADASGAAVALSPIVYESVFSQMSLIGYLKSYTPDVIGQPFGFLVDAVSFTVPRFLNPNKDVGTVLEPYFFLNPLGAFSGHAAGLIYFGFSLPVFYFVLGGFGSWLQFVARRSPAFFVIYLYFTTDILFRLMRDGYVLPFKYFVDGCAIIVLACWVLPNLRFGAARLTRKRSGGPRVAAIVQSGQS